MNFRIILFLILLMPSADIISSSQSLQVRVRDQPDRETVTETTSIHALTVKFRGDEELERYYQDRGLTLPLTIETKETQTWRRTSGAVDSGGSFLVRVTLESFSSESILNGRRRMNIESTMASELGIVTIIRMDLDGQSEILGFEGRSLSIEEAEKRKQAFELALSASIYPERFLKIGDTFNQRLASAIPVPPLGSINYFMINTYTLDRIESGLGLFDIVTTFGFEEGKPDVDVTLEGKGKGRMTYDLALTITPEFTQSMNFYVQFSSGGFSGRASSQSESQSRSWVVE